MVLRICNREKICRVVRALEVVAGLAGIISSTNI